MSLYKVLDYILLFYSFAILGVVLFSWVPYHQRQNKVYYFLKDVTDPILGPIKKMVPPIAMMDWSPIIAFFIIAFLRRILVELFF